LNLFNFYDGFHNRFLYKRIWEFDLTEYLVKDLMVPLSEYATAPEGSTLMEAYLALEKAQELFDHSPYRHRAILILDKNKRVVGKLSQMDVLRALEPQSEKLDRVSDIRQYGFSKSFILKMRDQHRMREMPLKDLCDRAAKLKVENFMQTPTEGEYIEEDAPLSMAIHQIVAGTHLALLVTKYSEIVGVLRLSDVFAAVFHVMKENEPK
jgi:CBS domain-containing protein